MIERPAGFWLPEEREIFAGAGVAPPDPCKLAYSGARPLKIGDTIFVRKIKPITRENPLRHGLAGVEAVTIETEEQLAKYQAFETVRI